MDSKMFATPRAFITLFSDRKTTRRRIFTLANHNYFTIARLIGQKIKIPAPPMRVLAHLSSGENKKRRNGFFH